MSYSSMSFHGPQMDPWRRWNVYPGDIYLWQGKISGIRAETTENLKTLIASFGRVLSNSLLNVLDIRGAIVSPHEESDDSYWLTFLASSVVILTFPRLVRDGEKQGEVWIRDDLSRIYPDAKITQASWSYYDEKDDNVHILDYWITQPILWDSKLKKGNGGVTQAWANGQGIFKSLTENGQNGHYGSENLMPFKTTVPGLVPPHPLDPAKTMPGEEGQRFLVWGAVALVAGYAVWEISRSK